MKIAIATALMFAAAAAACAAMVFFPTQVEELEELQVEAKKLINKGIKSITK